MTTINDPYITTEPRTWKISAAYAEGLGDDPQVWEDSVLACSIEEAEAAAQELCRANNGMDDLEEEYDGDWREPLVDIFARPAYEDVKRGLEELSYRELTELETVIRDKKRLRLRGES